MDHTRNQIRTLLDDVFVVRGKKYVNAKNMIFFLNQPIMTQYILGIKIFALSAIFISYLLFNGLFNSFIPVSIATVAVLVFTTCVGVMSIILTAYLEKHVGYWELFRKTAQKTDHKKQKREWRFVAVQ